jgi:hypothetical protein
LAIVPSTGIENMEFGGTLATGVPVAEMTKTF